MVGEQPIPEPTDRAAKAIVDAAYSVHNALGPGLLESVYEACLAHEIRKHGLPAETQVLLPVVYEDVRIESGYRIDILAGKCVVVEIKAVEALSPMHEAQLLTYLRLGRFRLGYLINFNVAHLKNGIKRMVV